MGRRLAAGIAAVALTCTGLALAAPPAGATTFDVTSGADDGSEGTFRWAVTQAGANPGDDVIEVDPAVTAITLDDCAAGRVAIAPTGLLTVNGNGTTISQTCAGEGVLGGIGDTTLNDLTVTGGTAAGDGGGIELDGALTLDGVTVAGNTAAGDGGGILTVGAVVRNSVIADNTAGGAGGGIGLVGGGELVLEATTIEGNGAADGGGVFVEGELTATDSSFVANRADAAGGGGLVTGIALVTGGVIEGNEAATYAGFGAEVLTVDGVTVTGNLAAVAIAGVGGVTVAVVGSAVVENIAPVASGVAALNSASVDTSTVAGNQGGGIFADGPVTLSYASIVGNLGVNVVVADDPVTSWASVIAGGSVADCDLGTWSMDSQGYNFGGDTTCGFTGTGDTDGGGDPLLDPLALNDGPTPNLLPRSGSPLLNKVPASDGACSGTDQRGFARPANGACDIGAVEVRQVSAVSASYSTPYQTSITTDLVPLVTDPDRVLEFYEVSGEISGTIDAQEGGLVTYTPAAGFSGTDHYEYVVCSGGSVICTATQTISITVGPGPAATPVPVEPRFTG